MKFGVCLPNYGPAVSPEAVGRMAQAAEAAGYHSVWTTDHILVPSEYAQPYGHMIEALISLGYLAGLTERVKLATSVLVLPQRDPILVAKQVAAIDLLSNGRAVLGVGVGWIEAEYRFMRTPFKQRGRIADEWIAVIRALWTEESPAFAGEWISFADTTFEPKPVQPGGVPIIVGGKSAAAIRRAARLGDGWHPTNFSLDELATGLAQLAQLSGGRAIPTSMRCNVSLDLPGQPHQPDDSPWPVSGSAQAAIDQIGRYAELGLDELVCYFKGDTAAALLAQLEAFAAQVMPAFQP